MVYDEFGPQFDEHEVLNNKKPINFVLKDPTPIKYIDPEFYIHNLAALTLLQQHISSGVHSISSELDQQMIQDWCVFHGCSLATINSWFVST